MYKLIDVWGNVMILIAFLGYSIYMKDMGLLILSYFGVGVWQLISMLVHKLLQNKFIPNKCRKTYTNLVLIILLIFGVLYFLLATTNDLSIFRELMMALLFGLLFLSPLMAIWYFSICCSEVQENSKRPLAILKN